MPAHAPADWFPDPFGRFDLRYWDGSKWTHHVSSGGRQQSDPPVAAAVRTQPQAQAQAQPGWHPDPTGRHELRFWDGQWTEHVTTAGRPAVDPLKAPASPVASSGDHESAVVSRTEYPEVRLPVAAPVARTSKPATQSSPSGKVQRQVRRSRVDTGRLGGGTLVTESVLVVNQKAKLVGSTLAYDVYDQGGRQLGAFQEVRRDLLTKLDDRMRKRDDRNRTYRFEVVDMDGNVIFAMTRPEQWFTAKSSMEIEGPRGAVIGQIAQETYGVRAAGAAALQAGAGLAAFTGFGAIAGIAAAGVMGAVTDKVGLSSDSPAKNGHVRFGLDAGGKRLGSIHAMDFNSWDFRILDVAGVEIGSITKTWAGWTKERFTKADNYVVQMDDDIEDPLRSLIVAAALAIDVALKQGDPSRAHGSVVWGTRTRRYQ